MIITIIVNKFKSLLLFFVTLLRRALCCFRRRRRVSSDVEPLTGIGIITNETTDDRETWNDWGKNFTNRSPATVQEHIEYYRQQKAAKQPSEDEEVETANNFFEDMTPRITSQRKIFINTGGSSVEHTNNLLLAPDPSLMGSQLGEWEENPGWEGETLDWDAQEALRAKKRQERERKALEQQQRRIERTNRTHSGININT